MRKLIQSLNKMINLKEINGPVGRNGSKGKTKERSRNAQHTKVNLCLILEKMPE